MEEKKVDFLQQIEFLKADTNTQKRNIGKGGMSDKQKGGKERGTKVWTNFGGSTQEREMGDCSQDCPSTLLVTLSVLTHI